MNDHPSIRCRGSELLLQFNRFNDRGEKVDETIDIPYFINFNGDVYPTFPNASSW